MSSLSSGEAVEMEVSVVIPTTDVPVNAYTGTVTVNFRECNDGPLVSDWFTLLVEVLPTQGTLDIVEPDLVEEFCPPDDPWVAVGEVPFSFSILANGDHRNIRISSGGLMHDTLDETVDEFSFYPEEIAFMAAGETRLVSVVAYVPVG